MSGDYEDLNIMTTETKKLTAEEAKQNNRNNEEKYEHETIKCYVY